MEKRKRRRREIATPLWHFIRNLFKKAISLNLHERAEEVAFSTKLKYHNRTAQLKEVIM